MPVAVYLSSYSAGEGEGETLELGDSDILKLIEEETLILGLGEIELDGLSEAEGLSEIEALGD